MNNEKKTIIIAIVAILIIAIGASYAFFTAGISSEDTTTIRTDAGIMKVNYEGGASINLSGIYPRDEVWATKNITVTGNNTTDAKMYYKLTLIVDSNTFLTSDPLQYELTSTNTSSNGEIIPTISKTNLIGTTIELGNGYFNKSNNARHTYQLKIYYPKTTKDQNANQGKAFSAHVEIASVKDNASLISFYLNGNSYNALSNMTFKDWRDSDYNTFGYYYSDNAGFSLTDKINNNGNYNFIGEYFSEGHGGNVFSVSEKVFNDELSNNFPKEYLLLSYYIVAKDFDKVYSYVDSLLDSGVIDEYVYEDLIQTLEKVCSYDSIIGPYYIKPSEDMVPNEDGKYEYKLYFDYLSKTDRYYVLEMNSYDDVVFWEVAEDKVEFDGNLINCTMSAGAIFLLVSDQL